MVSELPCEIIYIAFQYMSNCVLIDAGYSTGIISNIVTLVHNENDYHVEILANIFEVSLSTENIWINENQESISAKFLNAALVNLI